MTESPWPTAGKARTTAGALSGGPPQRRSVARRRRRPVFQYTHANGNCCHRRLPHRGAAIPAPGGLPYTDYRDGRTVDAAGNAGDAVALTDQPGSIVSFGEDANGEIYVCSLSGNTVYRIDPA